mgnify:CR=1 FL=1
MFNPNVVVKNIVTQPSVENVVTLIAITFSKVPTQAYNKIRVKCFVKKFLSRKYPDSKMSGGISNS